MCLKPKLLWLQLKYNYRRAEKKFLNHLAKAKPSLNFPLAGSLRVRRSLHQILCPKQRKRCFLRAWQSVQKSWYQLLVSVLQNPWCVFIFPLNSQLAQLACPQIDFFFTSHLITSSGIASSCCMPRNPL